jgi:hypothetical protein
VALEGFDGVRRTTRMETAARRAVRAEALIEAHDGAQAAGWPAHDNASALTPEKAPDTAPVSSSKGMLAAVVSADNR